MKITTNLYIKSAIILFIFMLGTSSCNEDMLEENVYSFVAKENFYKTAEDAESAILGVYAGVATNGYPRENNWYYGKWYYDLVQLPDDQVTIDRAAAFLEFENFNIAPDNPFLEIFWTLSYKAINFANVAVSRIPPIKMSENLKQSYLAEARCIRASVYFTLVRLFGSVPFTLEEVGDENSANIPMGSIDEIYMAIIEDLEFAEENLPVSRPANEFGRVTKWVAKAFLADVLLTREEWGAAASKANEIINSGQFDLLDNFEDVFSSENELNKEIIYSIIYDGVTYGTWLASFSHAGGTDNANCFSGARVWSVDVGSDMWLNWNDEDLRKELSVGDTYLSKDGTYKPTPEGFPEFRKWNAPNEIAVNRCPINPIIYRYADVLLMYAEALSQANGGPSSEAYEAVNMVRRRGYGLPIHLPSEFDLSSGLDAVSFRDSVLWERSLEFVCEAKRLFDLMRTDQFPQKLVDMGKNVRPGARYFPIPFAELDANSTLSSADQNAGY